MKKIKIYGIRNCDTMKKAFAWFDKNKIAYDFHDYKKSGADDDVLRDAVKAQGWENVINRKGTTWRALPEQIRDSMNEARALRLAAENPSIIKRPLIVYGDKILLGFDEILYAKTFRV